MRRRRGEPPREKEKLEGLIEEYETSIAENEAEMCKTENLSNHQYLEELDKKNKALRVKLEEAYEKWMEM